MTLHNEVKQLIIDSLNLEGMIINDIDSQAPLFGDGLGLDSIDALELGLAIKHKFNIVLSANNEANRDYFYSVDSLVNFIETHQKG